MDVAGSNAAAAGNCGAGVRRTNECAGICAGLQGTCGAGSRTVSGHSPEGIFAAMERWAADNRGALACQTENASWGLRALQSASANSRRGPMGR